MADPKLFHRDHYADVTNRIIAALEAGTPPWRCPWDSNKASGGGPLNGLSGHRYRGVNTLLLGMAQPMLATGDPRWLSFKQAHDKGWRVRKGERATTVFFFKKVQVADREAADGGEDTHTVPVLRSYPVFHASQVDGIPAYVPPTVAEAPWRTSEAASAIVICSGAVLREGGDKAFYAPSTDSIQMPTRAAFRSAEGWAATMLHELGHWTGHPSRLDRNLSGRFGTQAYAMEELRAELASVFVGAEIGIPAEIDGHASYIQSWLEVLRRDKREVFRAAADAQRIADYVLAFHPLYAARLTAERIVDAAEGTTVAPSPPPGEMPAHVLRGLGRKPVDNLSPVFLGHEEAPPSTFRPR